ncbi:hypothetical protein CERSUDRAFT_79972 [Gelatoporia subvermispora B]|uniref:Uncharacterized protein n=1 Tax=Ceriporiopsis subvermispora (strain B) TaxID=914234 RepID=M2QTC5_CERS8|nr:hypothetical protein CERSUDRAFT_79972 [Gelatoporia subvermispora B]
MLAPPVVWQRWVLKPHDVDDKIRLTAERGFIVDRQYQAIFWPFLHTENGFYGPS